MRLLTFLFLFPFLIFAQDKINLEELQPTEAYENVHSQLIYENEQSSNYLIWIKEGVKMHKHREHTESITVIEGYGIMTVGEEHFEIKKGDFFVIPKNTFHALEVKSTKPIKVISIQMPKFNPKDRIFWEE